MQTICIGAGAHKFPRIHSIPSVPFTNLDGFAMKSFEPFSRSELDHSSANQDETSKSAQIRCAAD
jgi:hypothetical protein